MKKKNKLRKISQQSTVQPLYKDSRGETITAAKIVQKKVKAPKIWRSGSISGKSTSSLPWISSSATGKVGSSDRKHRIDKISNISKESYRSDNKEVARPVKNMPAVIIPDLDSRPNSGIIVDNVGIDSESPYLLYSREEFEEDQASQSIENLEGLMSKLIQIADHMDKSGSHNLADFSDFLIKKASEASSIDYSKKFNDIIVRLIDSDINISNSKIIEVTNKFSNNIVLNMMNVEDIDVAKKEAYDKLIKSIDRHLS